MSRLFESIKIINKKAVNLRYHNIRFNRSRQNLFNCKDEIRLEDKIIIPDDLGNEIYKCKVIYNNKVLDIGFEPYEVKDIKTLKVIKNDNVNYEYKFVDRENLNSLFMVKGFADDIIIIKSGLVTDSSIANIVFSDGYKYVTPYLPLLKGTKRAQLLDEGKIIEEEIREQDIRLFKDVYLINAFREITNSMRIPVEGIRY